MTLTLISIGLNSHKDLSLRAIQAAQDADHLYAETYTMKLDTTPQQLSDTIGKQVHPLSRGGMEEDAEKLLQEAETGNVAVLVGGDALSATTHISLVVDATKRGIPVKVVHGGSIVTAVAETGLSLYKFGRTVTVPLPEKGPVDTVLRTLAENREHGLHTLILLDLNIPEQRYLTIQAAVKRLMEAGLPPDTLLVGVARLGSPSPAIKADKAETLKEMDFGEPPYAIIAPGRLHFIEEEALKVLTGCPPELLEGRKVQGEVDRLIEKYSDGCRHVLRELRLRGLPVTVSKAQVDELLDHTGRYLDDAEYYSADSKPVALTSVAYAEGILDALKLLGLAEFEW
ncbi:diphthine synthase [Candidatus Bathyarchaeota archaeon]|nr:diphthine synthase [Candidatus Bathyarchaeota archaeon]